MTAIALVLGAGGVAGSAFHAGTLAALEQATGWDPRTADLIVGTSAGSGVAASLRAGLGAADQYRRAQDLAVSEGAQAISPHLAADRIELPPRRRPPLTAFLHPTAPWLVAPAFLSPGPIRPGLLAGLAPRGTHPSRPLGDRIRAMSSPRWPDRPTWVVAVRLRDGKRTVFGREDVDVPDLGTAVEASSAVPGYFTPVRIDGHEYFDGGAYSTTNADLVAPLGFDLVVVVSPMTATPAALRRAPAHAARAMAARTLAREVGAIRARGTSVLVFQPTAADLDAMGLDLLDHDSSGPVARQAFASATAYLDRADVGDRVAVLRSAVTSAT